jgi:uncharacterized protein YkwD
MFLSPDHQSLWHLPENIHHLLTLSTRRAAPALPYPGQHVSCCPVPERTPLVNHPNRGDPMRLRTLLPACLLVMLLALPTTLLGAPCTYTVRPGDTLGKIAARNGTTVSAIRAANPALSNPNVISVGQQLVLPACAASSTATSSTAAATSAPAAPAAAPRAQSPQGFGEIMGLVNATRQRHGVSQLTWNDALALAAQRHANDIAGRRVMSHTGSDGSNPKQRAARAGYPASPGGVRASENFAAGTAAEVVTIFLNSPPHRYNMLLPQWREVGIGRATRPWGTELWVLVFGVRP